MTQTSRLLVLVLFAIAMAHVEAALVVYLRELYYPDHPRMIFPLRLLRPSHLGIEFARETATVVMILAVALLAERGVARVFAAFVFVFGLWDIFYYLWLKLMIGWPSGWLDWDVLFLIPWPWFGPWIAPALIALIFSLWGGWILCSDRPCRLTRAGLAIFVIGTLLALASFLLPGAGLLPQGPDGFRGYQPDYFAWWLFVPGSLLMVIGLVLVRPSAAFENDR